MLMVATVITGLYWVAEKLVFLPQRRRDSRTPDVAGQRPSGLGLAPAGL